MVTYKGVVMTELIEILETFLVNLVSVLAVCIELVGIGVLVFGAAKSLIKLLNRQDVKLDLARSITLSLEFLMCGEVLKTVTAHHLSELYILGAIVILRAAMTLLLHWEMKNEEQEMILEEKAEELAEDDKK